MQEAKNFLSTVSQNGKGAYYSRNGTRGVQKGHGSRSGFGSSTALSAWLLLVGLIRDRN